MAQLMSRKFVSVLHPENSGKQNVNFNSISISIFRLICKLRLFKFVLVLICIFSRINLIIGVSDLTNFNFVKERGSLNSSRYA